LDIEDMEGVGASGSTSLSIGSASSWASAVVELTTIALSVPWASTGIDADTSRATAQRLCIEADVRVMACVLGRAIGFSKRSDIP
jgi:hypothetical protein